MSGFIIPNYHLVSWIGERSCRLALKTEKRLSHVSSYIQQKCYLTLLNTDKMRRAPACFVAGSHLAL